MLRWQKLFKEWSDNMKCWVCHQLHWVFHLVGDQTINWVVSCENDVDMVGYVVSCKNDVDIVGYLLQWETN